MSKKAQEDISNYIPIEEIAKGPFGEVFKVKKQGSLLLYAAKVSSTPFSEELLSTKTLQEDFNTISQINHPSIVKYFEFFKTNFKNEKKATVITEFHKNGSLGDIISKKQEISSTKLNSTQKLINIYGIAAGLQHLHSHNIYHGNLKVTNILLDDHLCPQISDLLLHKYFPQKTVLNDTKNKFKDDIYSFGLIVYQILTNRLFDYECNIQFDEQIPESYKQLITSCISQDPNERPTFDQIVEELKTKPEFILSNASIEKFNEYIEKIEISNTNYINSFFDPKNYERQKEISEFLFFKTFEVIDKNTGEVKTVTKSGKEAEQISQEALIDFCREIRIISSITHPSILKFLGYSQVNFKDKPKPMLLCEGCPQGSLRNILRSKEKVTNLNDTKKLIILYGIASAMSFLHSNDIIHRNIKPEIIYLDKSFYPKLSGFLISRENAVKQPPKESKLKGTPKYSAPEIFLNLEYSKSSDVYSFALVMYEIMTNQIPFEKVQAIDCLHEVLCKKKIRPEIDQKIPECYRNLIERCWCDDPKERPTFKDIIFILKNNEEFITENINQEEFRKYIEYIDSTPKEIHRNKGIKELEELAILKTNQSIMADIVLDQKRSTESNFHINLNKYENLEKNLSNTVSNYKVCTIEENETKIQYTARIYYNELHQFSKSEIKNFCQELRIIPQLNHPAIIKFIGYSPINFDNKPTPTVVTDKYSRVHYGNWKFDVDKLLLDSFSFNDTEKLILLFGVASAMSYLHSHNIIHRDLKLENIDTKQLPRLFGFHFAKEIKGDFCKCHHLKGTPAFLAPEVLKNLEYSKSSDVYSFAYLMYIIMTNQRPFSDDQSPQQLIKKICDEKIRPEFKLPIPKCYRQLIERCWSEDPSKRPSFDDILSELRTNRDFITDTVIEKQKDIRV